MSVMEAHVAVSGRHSWRGTAKNGLQVAFAAQHHYASVCWNIHHSWLPKLLFLPGEGLKFTTSPGRSSDARLIGVKLQPDMRW